MKILIEESVLRQALELWETGKGIELGNLLRAAIKAAEKVEPVAWISTNTSSGESCIARSKITSKYEGLYEWQPLYLHPPSAEIEELRKLIANESYALSFQTLGQYRSALLKRITTIQGK